MLHDLARVLRLVTVLGEGQGPGEYPNREEAGQLAGSVLEVLAGRITPGEADDLAAQLPGPLAQAVRRGRREQAQSYGVQDFCQRVAERTGARPKTAEWDASAVLSTLADAVSGGECCAGWEPRAFGSRCASLAMCPATVPDDCHLRW